MLMIAEKAVDLIRTTRPVAIEADRESLTV
jgi:hypothetical protein